MENPATSLVTLDPRLIEVFKKLRKAGIVVARSILLVLQLHTTKLFRTKIKNCICWNLYCNNLSAKTKVGKAVFQMRYFGANTQKPTMVLTNSPPLKTLHGRRVKKGKKKSKSANPLCRKYKSKSGKPSYCGTKWLKRSQKLSWLSLFS